MEALRLVPPEILRFLVANSKPSKAIEFDTGMGLVNLADEYERLTARDLDAEMAEEELSRRKLVQLEDAKVALALSSVDENDTASSTSVSFRHLALLAKSRRTTRTYGRVCRIQARSRRHHPNCLTDLPACEHGLIRNTFQKKCASTYAHHRTVKLWRCSTKTNGR